MPDALPFGMSALTEPYVNAAEEHVLRTFARHDAATLSSSLLFDESGPFTHADIARALGALEHRQHALLRYSWDGTDWVTLTLHGIARRGTQTSAPTSAAAPQLVYEHPHRFRANGHDYSAFIPGMPRTDG